MKLLVTLMSLIIAFQASAASAPGLQAAFDEFTYTVEVENNKQLATKNLSSQLAKFRSQGMTNQDILDSAMGKVNDPVAKADIKKMFEMYDTQAMSTEEFNTQLAKIIQMSQAKGASWSGSAETIVGVVLLIAITAWILSAPSSTCTNCSTGYYYDPYYSGYYYDSYYWDSYYYDSGYYYYY